MIKFKEHDGLLFKMLEEPVPLRENDENVLVRFITQGIIGEYVMEHWLDCNQKNVPIYVEGVDSDGDVTVWIENGNEHHCCPFPMFEIIGTPVAEGSAEWALYQIMQGRKVCCSNVVYKALSMGSTTNIGAYYIGDPIHGGYYCTVDTFLLESVKTDWQLYEPKPKPKQDKTHPAINGYNRYDYIPVDGIKMPKPEPIFTTGDKVTDGVIEGTIIHIEDAIADVCPSTDEYKIELRNLNHIPESPKQDDVEKPLRSMIAEAKEIGKNIRTYYQDMVFTPQALEACLNQGKFRWWNICNWELTTREQNYFPSISTSSDKPKEEPPKEPDYVICKRCGGSKSIPTPAMSDTAYTTCPKCGGTGYEIKEQKPDNLYLNIKPSNPADWCFDKKNLLVLVDNNFKGIVGENVTREQVGEIAKLLTEPEQHKTMPVNEFADLFDAPIGWICKTRDGGSFPLKYIEVSPTRYAYEDKSGLTVYVMANGRYKKNGTDGRDIISCEHEQPKPEPQYKVGDWVEYRLHANTAASDNNMMGQIIDIGRIEGTSIEVLPVGNYEHNSSLSTYHVIYASRIIRKLKPSEVIVNIGCLSGTVEDLSYASDGRFWLIGKATERCQQGMFVLLYDEMLDAQTRELVEGLLKDMQKQEEEK